MRFVDFDAGLRESVGWSDTFLRERGRQYRAFVRAVRLGLGSHRIESPWAKLYIQWVPYDIDAWQPGAPKLGLSAAGFTLRVPDDELLTAEGETVRPVLARSIEDVRERLRSKIGWEGEEFWRIVAGAGAHRGRYAVDRGRMTSTDRKSKVTAGLRYEWDETGTTVYAVGRPWPSPDRTLWRVQVADFPGSWDLEFAGVFAPAKVYLTASKIVVVDQNRNALAEVERPDHG